MFATVKAALEEAEARSRPARRTDRRGDQLRGADGRPRQLGRHHQPDLPRAWPRASVARAGSTASTLPTRCRMGAKTAYGAVAKPVEGTILTVIRESADAAVTAAERDNDIETVLTATRRRRREVGRADAQPARDPARGRRRRFGRAGAVPALPGRAPPPRRHRRRRAPHATAPQAGAGVKPSTLVAHADEGFGYETMFLLQPNGSGEPRRRRHPRPPRVDRRVGARGGRHAARSRSTSTTSARTSSSAMGSGSGR